MLENCRHFSLCLGSALEYCAMSGLGTLRMFLSPRRKGFGAACLGWHGDPLGLFNLSVIDGSYVVSTAGRRPIAALRMLHKERGATRRRYAAAAAGVRFQLSTSLLISPLMVKTGGH